MAKIECSNRLRVVLAEKEITNRWLAEQMGVTDMTVSRWKTNKVQPSMAQFVEIAQLLKVDIKDLIGKSSVSCPLKPSDSAPLKHSTMPP